MFKKLIVATVATITVAGCDKIGSPFDNPAKTCVDPGTFGQLMGALWGTGEATSHLHRDKLSLTSADAVLVSFDKTTRKITCKGTMKISDGEHHLEETGQALWSVQPTADGQHVLYEFPAEGVLPIKDALFTLEAKVTMATPAPAEPAPPSPAPDPAAIAVPAASDAAPATSDAPPT